MHQELFQLDDWGWLKNELSEFRLDGKYNQKRSLLSLNPSPKVASFFAGAGGMDLGLTWAGYEIVYANEIDKSAALTYNRNFKHQVDNRSILDVEIDKIPDHDLLVGGFPCQPFSYAGKRKGLVDDRGMLFFALVEDLSESTKVLFIREC